MRYTPIYAGTRGLLAGRLLHRLMRYTPIYAGTGGSRCAVGG